MFSQNRHSHWWSILILALIAGAYFLTRAPADQAVFSGPVYQGTEGVMLECAVRWNAQSLPALLELAQSENTPVAFFVSARMARADPDLLSNILRHGCEAGLLLEKREKQGILEELKEGTAVFSACGAALRFVMPGEPADAALVESLAAKEGLSTVLSSFDLLNRSCDSAEIAARVEKECFEGAIIRFEPTKTMTGCFSEILETLRSGGYVPQPLSALLR